VDTNVIVSFLTNRSAAQQRQARTLLIDSANGIHRSLLLQAVVTEAVYVLARLYGMEARRIAVVLQDLMGMPGVTVLNDVPWTETFAVWPREIDDFADAILAVIAQQNGFAVATFDKKLARTLHAMNIPVLW